MALAQRRNVEESCSSETSSLTDRPRGWPARLGLCNSKGRGGLGVNDLDDIRYVRPRLPFPRVSARVRIPPQQSYKCPGIGSNLLNLWLVSTLRPNSAHISFLYNPEQQITPRISELSIISRETHTTRAVHRISTAHTVRGLFEGRDIKLQCQPFGFWRKPLDLSVLPQFSYFLLFRSVQLKTNHRLQPQVLLRIKTRARARTSSSCLDLISYGQDSIPRPTTISALGIRLGS